MEVDASDPDEAVSGSDISGDSSEEENDNEAVKLSQNNNATKAISSAEEELDYEDDLDQDQSRMVKIPDITRLRKIPRPLPERKKIQWHLS